MSEIFPEEIEPAVLYTKNLANPVHVQSAETGAKNDRRPYVRLDLIALANIIVRVEADHVRLVNLLTDMRTQLSILQDQVKTLQDGKSDPKIARMLTALAQIEFEATDDDTSYDRYRC